MTIPWLVELPFFMVSALGENFGTCGSEVSKWKTFSKLCRCSTRHPYQSQWHPFQVPRLGPLL